MPELDAVLRRELHSALLSAFPDEDKLQMLASFALNRDLSSIVIDDSLGELVFKLIKWVEANDCVEDLVQEALRQRPKDRELRSIATQLGIAASTYSNNDSPGPRKAQSSRVIIIRERQFVGSSGKVGIFIDDEERALTLLGQPVTIDVGPGPHKIQAKWQSWHGIRVLSSTSESKVLSFTLEEGEDVIFKCQYTWWGQLELEGPFAN